MVTADGFEILRSKGAYFCIVPDVSTYFRIIPYILHLHGHIFTDFNADFCTVIQIKFLQKCKAKSAEAELHNIL